MKRSKLIRKVLVLAAWLLVIGGITTLLVAANRKQKNHVCRQVLIAMTSAGDKLYLDKNDVLKLIERTAGGSLLQRGVTSVDLARLENSLESNAWIRDAELYFDSKDALHVAVAERQPIARVFTTLGTSFYIDSSGHAMPLLDKMSARVPVVTGFTAAKRWNGKDSALMMDVKTVASYVYEHPFWNAQIGQIDITPQRKFELVPVVGDHIIRLGDAQQVDQKLERLYVFYQQVLSKTGFSQYAALDVQYDGQVVAVKRVPASPIDSIQLLKNIDELVKRAATQDESDTLFTLAMNNALLLKDSASAIAETDTVVKKPNPIPAAASPSPSIPKKTTAVRPSKPVEKPKQPVKPKPRTQPKAVMGKG